ncbi:hypothetical protein ACS7SF_24500 (plasmid) [Ralstonia sp. 25C]
MDHQLDAIEHVVVLMLENRSFDPVLGFCTPPGRRATGSHSMA